MPVRTRSRRPLVVEALEARKLLATLTVTSKTDGATGSLRDLIARAAPGDVIRFAANLSGAILHLTLGELTVAKNLTIQGTSQVLDADGLSRVLHVTGPQTNATVKNLTITDGRGALNATYGYVGGGIFVESATLTLDGCTLAGNKAGGGGDKPGSAYVEAAVGGALFGISSHVSLKNCTVWANHALGGGNTVDEQAGAALGGGGGLVDSQITVTGGSFLDNLAQGGSATTALEAFPTSYGGLGAGGGLWLFQSNATLTGVTMSLNVAQGGNGLDGILAHDPNPSPQIGPGGGGNASGGAIYDEGPSNATQTSTLTLKRVTLTQNRAQGGDAGAPKDNTQPANQGGTAAGGAVCTLPHVTLILNGTNFNGNQALGGGAAANAPQAGSDTGTGGQAVGGTLATDTPTRIDADAIVIRNSFARGGKGADSAPNIGTEAGEGGFAYGGGWFLINNTGGLGHPPDLLPASIRHSKFQNNTVKGGVPGAGPLPADGHGGGGASQGGGMIVQSVFDLSLIANTWAGNQSRAGQGKFGEGGALVISFGTDQNRTLIQGGQFTGNKAYGGNDAQSPFYRVASGGALFLNAPNTMIVGATFKDNQAIGGADTGSGLPGSARGGAIVTVGHAPSLTITNSTFIGNQALGGAILVGQSTPATQSGRAEGGAIYHVAGPLQITGGKFANNAAIGCRLGTGHDAEGGALYLAHIEDPSSARLSGVNFTENTATAYGNNPAHGGAIANYADSFTDTGSTFSGNTARTVDGGTALGGALWTRGDIVLQGTTITHNAALAIPFIFTTGQGFGGGIAFDNNPKATLVQTRITRNRATTDGPNLWGTYHA
jgi:hypothetical protein